MATIYAQLPVDMQEALSTNAGMLLSTFDPASPGNAEVIRSNILFATSGGVSVTCVATISDFGSDVDNCPKNTKELAQIDSWECKMSGTALTTTADGIARNLGAADVSSLAESGVSEVSPRMAISPEDFEEIWYVCKYGTNDGFIAVKMNNSFSTGGFSLQSGDKAKGQYSFEYTGYTSIDTPDEVPMKFYIKPSATAQTEEVTPTI